MKGFEELEEMSKEIINKNKMYYLKNKDRVLLEFYFDDIGVPEIVKVHDNTVPEFIERKFGDWLCSRTPPKHRAFMKELFNKLQIDSNDIKGVLDYSKGLSLTDTLWVTNTNNINWSEVSLYQNKFDYVISRIAFDGGHLWREYKDNFAGTNYGWYVTKNAGLRKIQGFTFTNKVHLVLTMLVMNYILKL